MNMSEFLVDTYVKLIQFPLQFLGYRKKNIFLAHICQKTAPYINIPVCGKSLQFYCPGVIPEFRARTLLTKEPETIEWLDSFEDGSVFYDIGANVGCYTLYACLRGIRTLCFEPSAFNYFVLCENIRINGFDNVATAYCVAFSDVTGAGALNMMDPEVGSANINFGSDIPTFKASGQLRKANFRQGMLGYALDDFVATFDVSKPTYVKIDVDGIEDKILGGALKTLQHECVRSVLVEVDQDDSAKHDISRRMALAGFELSHKGDTISLGSLNSNLANFIYVRK